ncbi:hypothetical protein [Psychroflexus halocasei]|uniref:hypothetical protein n=1 Tax=Psychroflexus halocasei TaxID=908615 RepID=UPI0013565F41|nr:hypothetical protein [Psychroflexus halocasei]
MGSADDGYELYIVDENLNHIFKKSSEIEGEDFSFISYNLRIPNQNDPMVVLSFTDQDSTSLRKAIRGGNGSGYDFNFFYDSRKYETKFIEEGKYIENKISISYLLSSNLEILDDILEKASKIYILEKTDKPGFRYIAREVKFSIYAKL